MYKLIQSRVMTSSLRCTHENWKSLKRKNLGRPGFSLCNKNHKDRSKRNHKTMKMNQLESKKR